jgi:hypothetical protein
VTLTADFLEDDDPVLRHEADSNAFDDCLDHSNYLPRMPPLDASPIEQRSGNPERGTSIRFYYRWKDLATRAMSAHSVA